MSKTGVCKMNDDQVSKARPNAVLLARAKEIFGPDLVVNAWVQSTWPVPDENEMNEELDEAEEHLAHSGDLAEIDFSNMEIVLEFCNGRFVCFENSEWAFITKQDAINE